jgi:hypothetical protein
MTNCADRQLCVDCAHCIIKKWVACGAERCVIDHLCAKEYQVNAVTGNTQYSSCHSLRSGPMCPNFSAKKHASYRDSRATSWWRRLFNFFGWCQNIYEPPYDDIDNNDLW